MPIWFLIRSTTHKVSEFLNLSCSSFQDFVIGLSIILRGTIIDRLNWAFNLYDLNKDGCITKEVKLTLMFEKDDTLLVNEKSLVYCLWLPGNVRHHEVNLRHDGEIHTSLHSRGCSQRACRELLSGGPHKQWHSSSITILICTESIKRLAHDMILWVLLVIVFVLLSENGP